MEGVGRSGGCVTTPFVMRTYQMVNDASTNTLITWGSGNNSFIVLEPLEFSRRILPVYFKHSNFASFVRQLNTYGFKKVDPDHWEFANEWFLRGQTQILSNIVRKKHSTKTYTSHHKIEDGEFCDEKELVLEIAKLRQEQKSLEQELESLTRRLEATEKRPQQMMTFLYKIVDDPDILPRMMLDKEKTRHLLFIDSKKKRKLMMSSTTSNSSSGMAMSSSSIESEEDREGNTFKETMTISSPDGNSNADICHQSSTQFELSSPKLLHQRQSIGVPAISQERPNPSSFTSSSMLSSYNENGVFGAVSPPMDNLMDYSNFEGFNGGYFGELLTWENDSDALPHPFSSSESGL
ncbi:heat stress transcription factor C-1b-like [Primulina tabacum]|uniref:heat stress transcription factor C-1b-like n=1 Tax=Primulina tabacum TaxID=48773 RepID=UPI003F5ABE39